MMNQKTYNNSYTAFTADVYIGYFVELNLNKKEKNVYETILTQVLCCCLLLLLPLTSLSYAN